MDGAGRVQDVLPTDTAKGSQVKTDGAGRVQDVLPTSVCLARPLLCQLTTQPAIKHPSPPPPPPAAVTEPEHPALPHTAGALSAA